MSEVQQVEIPEEIRNLDLFNHIMDTQTPARTKDRELYMKKLLMCSPEDIKNVMFLNDTKSNTFRKSIESISASKQCHLTIGQKCIISGQNKNTVNNLPNFNHTNTDNSRCWLCGYAFECGDDIDCEHLIPVTFAGLFTGIKSTKRVKNFSNAFERAYSTNYLYAHASCNRSKSDIMLITWDDDNGPSNREGMVFDNAAGTKLQQRILEIVRNKYPMIHHDTKYADDMMANFRTKMDVICNLINSEYNAFLRHGLSMTDYIKYVVSMTQIYFSKKRLESLKSEHDRRESLGEIASIKKEMKDEAGNVFDIVQLNEIHTTAKKMPKSPGSGSRYHDPDFNPKRLFRDDSDVNIGNSNSPVALRTRSKRPRFDKSGRKDPVVFDKRPTNQGGMVFDKRPTNQGGMVFDKRPTNQGGMVFDKDPVAFGGRYSRKKRRTNARPTGKGWSLTMRRKRT